MLRTFVIFLAGALIGTAATVFADQDGWPWGPELDAVAAAPNSHRVLLENEAGLVDEGGKLGLH